jgi:hypothetical protein
MIAWVRRCAAFALVTLAASGMALAMSGPAQADDDGYVRLAHLSPDTPAVDVYLSAVSGDLEEQMFPAVGYGVVSEYMPLPAGTYTVAMRAAGAPDSDPPVLTTSVTVAPGEAYTVAGVGHNTDLGLRVITDDLASPAAGKARVRIVQASAQVVQLRVSAEGKKKMVIADEVAFATTTDYVDVNPGRWPLRLQPLPTGMATDVDVDINAGGVYSVFVLDTDGDKITAEVRTDAQNGVVIPENGVETGAGGTAALAARTPLLLAAGAGMLLAVIAALGLRRVQVLRRR